MINVAKPRYEHHTLPHNAATLPAPSSSIITDYDGMNCLHMFPCFGFSARKTKKIVVWFGFKSVFVIYRIIQNNQ
jgi:hypothetical protein